MEDTPRETDFYKLSSKKNWFLQPIPSESQIAGEVCPINSYLLLPLKKTSTHDRASKIHQYFLSALHPGNFSGSTWLCVVEEFRRGGSATNGATLSCFQKRPSNSQSQVAAHWSFQPNWGRSGLALGEIWSRPHFSFHWWFLPNTC